MNRLGCKFLLNFVNAKWIYIKRYYSLFLCFTRPWIPMELDRGHCCWREWYFPYISIHFTVLYLFKIFPFPKLSCTTNGEILYELRGDLKLYSLCVCSQKFCKYIYHPLPSTAWRAILFSPLSVCLSVSLYLRHQNELPHTYDNTSRWNYENKLLKISDKNDWMMLNKSNEKLHDRMTM